MSDPADGVTDWADPCARAKALRDAYYDLISGKRAVKVRFKDGDNEQEIGFAGSTGTADLKRELAAAEDECSIKCGKRPKSRRFALTGGILRRPNR